MSSLIPLHFDRFDVRMVMRGNVPWWVLADVCSVLEIANPRNAAQRLEEYQKGVHTMDTLGGPQDLVIVNEAGIYALALNSRKPEAKAFGRWLFTEVLPSIRKHGSYPPPPEPETLPALPAPLAVLETRPARFLQECERLAAEHGAPVEALFEHIVSPAQFKAMRRGAGDLDKLLTREMRWVGFMNMGMDLAYVMAGQRSLPIPD